ncbi:MAG: hypothetical protein AAGG38_12350 [Planctomycetota bacterium]
MAFTYTEDGLLDTEALTLLTYPNGTTVRFTYTSRDQFNQVFRDPEGPNLPGAEVELERVRKALHPGCSR